MGEPEAKREVPPGASPISGLPPPVETRWKPGQSGNPGGRPKGESITALLRRVLEREHNGKPLMEVLAERLVKEAIAGKHPFVKELLDRLDGRPTETHRVAAGAESLFEALAAVSTEEKLALIRRAGLSHLLGPGGLDERAEPPPP